MKVIQNGPRTAKIMLVGEAPGDTEVRSGQPFTGGAGQLLEHAMSRAGVSMSECFQTNVTHVPPPVKGKFETFYKKANQLPYLQGVLQLQKDIRDIKPNVVVPLGTHALLPLTGKKGIDKWRGSILESTIVKGQKVVGTYNPAYALRVYEAKAIIEIDFQRIRDESKDSMILLPIREYFLSPEPSVRRGIVEQMLLADWLAVDIECVLGSDGKWHITQVNFSDRPNRALVILANSHEERNDIRRLVESDVSKVYQNGQFDTEVLTNEGYRPKSYAWDCMYAHHALFAEAAGGEDELSKMGGKKKMSVFKKGLAFQTSIYTREPFYKDDSKIAVETSDPQLYYLYGGKDAAVTREIQAVQERELDEFGTRCVFDHEMAMLPALQYASRRGIKIDMEKRADLKQKYTLEIERLQDFLDKQAGHSINVKSTPVVMGLLYDQLKLPTQYNKKTGNPTGDKDAINFLAGKYQHPLLLTILNIRERRDYLERYIDIPLGADRRMRCLFDPSGTRSGRLASRTALDGSGTNLQTIPARKAVGEQIKQMFVADEGKIFIYPDYKQAEAWLVAYLAKCEGLIELFNDPSRDVHYENASRIFGKPISQITLEERYLAKRVVHASNYGMGPDRLVELVAEDAATTGVRITRSKANDLMQKYFMIYPEIKGVFWKDVEREIRHTRVLNTPFGRKRAFFARMDDKLLREAYSYVPQSTVGDLGGKAVTRVYNEVQLGMADLGAEFLLNVHDSILVQCDESKYQECAKAVQEAMRIPITVDGRTFTIPTDCKIGRNWGSRSVGKDGTIINPAGMRDIVKGDDGLWTA